MSGKDGFNFSLLIARISNVKDYLSQRQKPIGLVLLGLIIISGGIWGALNYKKNPEIKIVEKTDQHQETVSQDENQTSNKIIVDVSGAVKNPDVYSLDENSRIQDALDQAGGLSEEADLDLISKNINFAEKIFDGQKIYFTKKSADNSQNPNQESFSQTETAPSKISLNKASYEQLDSLPGIGEKRAKAIIDNRPYQALEDLITRKIIPSSVFEKIKEQIIL